MRGLESGERSELLHAYHGDGVASRLEDEGLVYLHEGFPVVAMEAADELAGDRDVFVLWLPPEIAEDSDATASLVQAARQTWPETTRTLLRFAPGEVPADAERRLRLYSRWVAKTPAARARPPGDVVVRPPGGEDEAAFVRDLLAAALVAGYDHAGIRLSTSRALRFVEREYPSFDGRDVSAVVAEIDGQLAGHGTWSRASTDELTGETFQELVDVFVLEPFRTTGAFEAIVAEIERRAARAPGRLLGHVVAEPSGRDLHVREGLERRGWTEVYTLWIVR